VIGEDRVRRQNGRRNGTVVIGGGPAGLTAALKLARHGLNPVVVERDGKVGGMARTEEYKGFRFDMGGHRFFTTSEQVRKFWEEMLGHELLTRPRLSRIYYRRQFYYYPLRPLNVLAHLGLGETVRIIVSYLYWQCFPHRCEETFEQWVTNRFGRRLFETFFKRYTEKVWGISCSELKAEWAAQRIKDLSLKTALLNMLWKRKGRIRTLIEEFSYPRLGPGMMWSTVQENIHRHGGTVHLNTAVLEIAHDGHAVRDVLVQSHEGQRRLPVSQIISSMPITDFITRLRPEPPADVLAAARRLHYRDFLTVCLIVNRAHLFPDNWIYIHDPGVKVGRIQNFKNWSSDMVPDQNKSSLGMEYFCQEGDEFWTLPDSELIALGTRESAEIGLVRPEDVEDGCVFRMPKAYPIYDSTYRDALTIIEHYVKRFHNAHMIGRNGLHRYDNQDHAMLTGMKAADSVLRGERQASWKLSGHDHYLEEVREARPVKELSGHT
jgi:protoporphyrinogen oxidase